MATKQPSTLLFVARSRLPSDPPGNSNVILSGPHRTSALAGKALTDARANGEDEAQVIGVFEPPWLNAAPT